MMSTAAYVMAAICASVIWRIALDAMGQADIPEAHVALVLVCVVVLAASIALALSR